MITVTAEPLTAAAFAPFGHVLQTEGADHFDINGGTTQRFHALAEVALDAAGVAILSIFRATAATTPITIGGLERHPLGSQAFMPLSPHPWLVVVARTPAAAEVRCFLATGHQGIQYDRNTWHHPLLILQPEQDFLVIDRAGPGENLDEAPLDTNVRLAVNLTPYEEASIWINAPIDVVWEAVANIDSLGRYSPETTGAEWLSPSVGHAVGSRFRGHNDNGTHTWHTDCEITDYSPQVVFGFGVGREGEFRTIWRYRFAAEDGGTRLTQSFESPLLADPPPGMNPQRRQVMAGMLTETLTRIRTHLEE